MDASGAELQDALSPIYVTRPMLPPLAELLPYLEGIWSRRVLTNGGPLHQQLEEALADYLGVPHVALFANATLALIAAFKVLGLRGEVITSPFSFAASVHALRWAGCAPVFADIDPDTLNLDPQRIPAALSPRSVGILPVHCYGHACDTSAIEAIADANGLRVVYDAAHAFGVRLESGSLIAHGDLSVISFHATKVFNTFEGGAIACADAQLKLRIDRFKNFGIVDEFHVESEGFNAKMSELHAAIGLAQLAHIDAALAARLAVADRYRDALAGLPGLRCIGGARTPYWNAAYFPVLIEPWCRGGRDAVYAALRTQGIHARRYFQPLVSSLPMYRDLPSAAAQGLPVATAIAERVLCLPIYPELTVTEQQRVVDVLRDG